MRSAVPQATYLAQLRRDAEAVTSRAVALAENLDERQFNWKPPDGGWSAGQVFEHLVIVDGSYLERIRSIVHQAGARRATPHAVWRPSLAGGLLVQSLRSPRKLPAPRMFRPAPQPRAHVVDAFMLRQRELVELLDASAGLDWRHCRTSSPITPLIRLNLGDCFTVIVVHAQRHLGQIERLQSHTGLPASVARA